jgi:hypothetical protein
MKLFTIIKTIKAELSAPDDQGNDWYKWCLVQGGHAMLGVLLALLLGWHGVIVAAMLAVLKEAFDLLKKHDEKAVLDSLQDASFWVIGAWLITAADKRLAIIIFLMALACGVIPRIRKAIAINA